MRSLQSSGSVTRSRRRAVSIATKGDKEKKKTGLVTLDWAASSRSLLSCLMSSVSNDDVWRFTSIFFFFSPPLIPVAPQQPLVEIFGCRWGKLLANPRGLVITCRRQRVTSTTSTTTLVHESLLLLLLFLKHCYIYFLYVSGRYI